MAFASAQITPVASTPTPLLVQGTGAGQFRNVVGTTSDPLPVQFMITSGAAFWGGPNVSGSTGVPMVPNVPVIMNVYGPSEIPYVFAATPPVVYVAVGRQ